MYRIKLALLFSFLIGILYSNKVAGQIIPLSENTEVSIITCGTGSEIYSLFGHTAIRIKDIENHIDEVYNYGTFDFSTPNFYLKFVKGDLQYLETSCAFEEFFQEYLYEKRSVAEQVLNISRNQKQALFDYLNASLQSEERFYTYKFIDKNCTTMVINTINKIIGKEVIIKNTKEDRTYRAILFPYFKGHFFEQLGTSIIFGTKVDLKGEELFLPAELQESIKTISYNNKPLCKENRKILEFNKEEIPFSWWNNYYTFSLLFVLVLIVNKNSIYKAYFIALGILGLFFLFAGFYSLHKELPNNYNILLFNPILFLGVYFQIKNNRKGILYISILSILCLLTYVIVLLDKPYLGLVLPLIITSLFGLVKLVLKNKN
ncbi:MAG: DUF4105 domain-containing protein [Flavobacteriaceae bacterium]|nr:DUF4105 domain-containing protein [Flavobacteriaceae bacterium]